MAGVMSDQFEEQIRSMTEFRKILSRNNAPVQQIIDTGVIPRFVLFLRTFNPDLQVRISICYILNQFTNILFSMKLHGH